MGRAATAPPAGMASPPPGTSASLHQPHRHDQPQQPQFASFRSRAAAARSRFQEGSMNDRVSAAPPPDFLGDDYTPAPSGTATAASSLSNRSSWAGPHTASDWGTTTAPPSSSCSAGTGNSTAPNPGNPNRRSAPSGEQAKQKSGSFFAPLWDGMRERLRLTRSKSSINVVAASAKDAAEPQPPFPPLQLQQHQHQDQHLPLSQVVSSPEATHPALGAAASGGPRPTREEVLQSYQALMKSGFFDSHAIQSSRHAPPPGMATSRPPTSSSSRAAPNLPSVKEHPPSRAPPPAPGHRRNIFSASGPKPRKRSGGFVAAAARGYFSECEDDDEMDGYASEHQRPSTSYGRRPSEPPSSPSRGTKRNHADGDSVTSNTENPARRLVKKLRKSTSRLTNRRNSDAAADAVAAVAAALRSGSSVNVTSTSPRKSGASGGGPPLSHQNNNCLYQQVEPPSQRKLTKPPSRKDLQDLEKQQQQQQQQTGSWRRRGAGGGATGVSSRPGSSYGGHNQANGLAPPPIGHMLRGAAMSLPPRSSDNKRSDMASPPPLPAPTTAQHRQSPHRSQRSQSASPTRTAAHVASPTSPSKVDPSVRPVAVPSFHYPQRVRRPGIQHHHHHSAGGPLSSLSPEDRRANRARPPSVPHMPLDFKSGTVHEVVMVDSLDGIENRRGWA